MKKLLFLQMAAVALTIGGTQISRADESVRVYTPSTPEASLNDARLKELESGQGEFRESFLFSFPPTSKLAVKVAVYRDGKLDTAASSLFHIYGIASNPTDASATNTGFFSLTRTFPQPPDKPRNGVTQTNWGVQMPGYSYGFVERAAAPTNDYRQSADFAETSALRRGKVVMTTATDKFRLSVWVQTVPRKKSEPRYGIKRFAVPASQKLDR